MSSNENLDGSPPARSDMTMDLPGKLSQYAATLGADANSESLIHDRSFGDYELLAEIARGAMGVVYRARQISLNRVVALKMILAGRFASTIDVQRFRQEAESAATLDHANILPIYEVGEHDGHQYFSMKLAEGGSLAEKMAELRNDPKQAIRVLEQIARGVHHAHQRGIMHRDLKPANILLQNDGLAMMNEESKSSHSSLLTPHSSLVPMVTDFGLAKRTEGDSGITQSGAIVGTPSYMSPEQARGSKIITTSADVYSLGAMLYEMLTGVPPFRGDSVTQTLRMVEEQEPIAPRNVNVNADADLEAVALKCLEKDPARRYETAGAFADDLSAWLRGEPVTARRAGWTRRARKWVRRNPAVAALTAIIVLVLIVGSTLSAILAVRAEKRAKEAAQSEREALAHEAIAHDREEVLQDTLCVATFERARAERMAGRPGWRTRGLELLQAAAKMRLRDRNPDDRRVALPDLGELRGEAVMALIASDASESREVPMSMASMTHISMDCSRMVQITFTQDDSFRATIRTVDLKTNQEIDRKAIRLDGKEPNPLISLTQIAGLDREGTRALCKNPLLLSTLAIHELPSGKFLTSLTDANFKAVPKAIDRARFSPDGTKVSAVRRSLLENKETLELVVWEVARPSTPMVLAQRPGKKADGMLHSILDIDLGEFSSTRFTMDSKRICYVSSDRKTIHVRDLSVDPPAKLPDIPVPGKLVTLDWHPTRPELAMLVSHTSGAQRPSLVLWDLAAGKARLTREWDFPIDSEEGFASLAFSPDGRTLAAGGGQYTTVHVFGADDLVEHFRLLDTALIGVARVFWTQSGELVVNSLMESLRFYKPSGEGLSESLVTIKPHGVPTFSSDGRWLAFFAPTANKSSSMMANIFDAKADKAILHERVALLDRKTGQVARYLAGQNEAEVQLLFSPDDKRIFVCSKNEIIGYDAADGTEVIRRVRAKGAGIRSWESVFFLPDGRLATLGHLDREKGKGPPPLTLWDLVSQRAIHVFSEKDWGSGLAETKVTPRGDRLLSANRMVFGKKEKKESIVDSVYELPSGRLLADIPRPDRKENQMEDVTNFSANGARMLAMNMTMMGEEASFTKAYWTVRSVLDGEELLKIPNRNFTETGNGFSADGRFVAVAADRGHVEVWDLTTRSILFRWQPHGGKSVEFLSFSPEGDIATSAIGDERLLLLRTNKIRERLHGIGLGW